MVSSILFCSERDIPGTGPSTGENSCNSQLWESQMDKVRRTSTEALWKEGKDLPAGSEEKLSHLQALWGL